MTAMQTDTTGARVRDFCARIGTDPLLVQGAGGNVSWKEGDRMWVKASGTWLADARSREIFVAVDRDALRCALAQGDFLAAPAVTDASGLRPSIETALHALMPHRVVVHLHAVEALAHLVRPDAQQAIRERLGSTLRHTFVPYAKPGPDLARAIVGARPQDCDLVFLASHGLVLGAHSADAAERLLRQVTSALATPAAAGAQGVAAPSPRAGYRPCSDPRMHALASDGRLLRRLESDWALYPDHVVFLGPKAEIIEECSTGPVARAPFLFVRGRGVLQALDAHAGHLAQLRCYLDVLEREPAGATLVSLSDAQIEELVSWDAEKHRQAIAPGAAR